MSFVNDAGKTNDLVLIKKIKKQMKFGLGSKGGWNFKGFSKSSLEIFHYFFV